MESLKHSGTVRPRRGFTIVELMMVVAIISVLITITISAISGSMKSAREQKAKALCTLVAQGLATYYAQEGEWPVKKLNDENITLNANADGDDPKSGEEKTTYRLESSEVRDAVKALVEKTRQSNPVIDVSGLFVSTANGESGSRGRGMDFMTAIHGSKHSKKKIKVAQMYFGYPEKSSGYFRRFKMYYSPATDQVMVSQQ